MEFAERCAFRSGWIYNSDNNATMGLYNGLSSLISYTVSCIFVPPNNFIQYGLMKSQKERGESQIKKE